MAKDFLSTMESPADADYAPGHLGQSVGLMVWAVGLFEEIIAHTIRSRVSQSINGKVEERTVYTAPVSLQRQASDRIHVTPYRQSGAGVFLPNRALDPPVLAFVSIFLRNASTIGMRFFPVPLKDEIVNNSSGIIM